MSMNGYFARWILCSGTTGVAFGLYSSIVGVRCDCDCEARAHNSAAEQMQATVAAETEIAGQDFIASSSGETRIVSHRAAGEPNIRSEGRTSVLDEAPLLAPRQTGHLPCWAFRLNAKVVRQLQTDPLHRVPQANFHPTLHSGFDHLLCTH